MDVYSAYQDQYIGSVIGVEKRAGEDAGRTSLAPESERGAGAEETGTAPKAVRGNPELVHEEGARVEPTGHMGRRQLGEEMGPFPTMEAGNMGPINQSAGRAYATGTGEPAGIIALVVRPGRINLGPLTRPLYIPTIAVRSISMERVVLAVQKEQIPRVWRRRPKS
jgi:hypothetical protein